MPNPLTTPVLVSQLVGGTKPYWVATSDRLPPVIQQRWKSHRQLCCFALIGAHQGGVLMVDVHWLPLNRASCPPTNWDTNTGVVGGFGVIPSGYSSMFEIVLSISDLPNFTHFFMDKLNLQNSQNEWIQLSIYIHCFTHTTVHLSCTHSVTIRLGNSHSIIDHELI